RNLHSNFRLGTGAGTLTELAASLAVVSLATGVYLWWPRTVSALGRSLVPRVRNLRRGRRRAWRDLHSAVGVVSLAALALLLVTGLTWTEYAGRWIDLTKRALIPEAPALATTLTDTTQEPAGHGEHRTRNGAAAPTLRTGDLDRVAAVAAGAGLTLPFAVTPPPAPGQAWSVTEIDDRWPIRRESIAVDPGAGAVVDRLAFSDNPLLEQATTIGIGFHEGTLFGLPNRIGLTVLALAVMVVVLSGYVMWWRRRPAGAFAAPPKAGPLLRTVPVPLLGGFGVLLILLPTLGVAFLGYLLAERMLRRGAPAAGR
ncbi:MAG TPA: PepSY domain-containing protein, partial [Acidimicrobiia bacterium]|nr:PepSY domain-containing protein [Acidimicrobiia bacterium]